MTRPAALSTIAAVLRRLLESLSRSTRGRRTRPNRAPARPGTEVARAWTGPVSFHYAPERDGQPDPGEVVWAWVPYEEDPGQGKDRPVVVVGVAAAGLLAVVPLSSRDHAGDPGWLSLGSGGWDGEGRPSSVRLDYVLAVPPAGIRREGAALDRERFDRVVTALRARHGWQ